MHDVKKSREEAVAAMQKAIDETSPSDHPTWLIATIAAPLFLIELVKLIIGGFFATAWFMVKGTFKVVIQPVLWLYICIDITLILGWFFIQGVKKLSRGAK